MSVFLLVSLSSGLLATEWHVAPPPVGDDSNPGTKALPFATVQRGIEAASDGDTVIVAEGTYVENIGFNGKNITLTSTDPLDRRVVKYTIIDGNKAGSVVRFSGTETEGCVLSGFTIRNGDALDGGGILGGTYPDYTHATIQNNTIAGNSARYYGGGLFLCDGTIQSNTITGNSAGLNGGGLYDCKGVIRNCIIWANRAPSGPQLDESSIPTYSCIQDWSGGGEGNTASEPRFVDLNAGDYRLQEGSPCIDAGYNDPSLPATDMTGMHRIMFGGKSLTVDMGAWEYYVNALPRELGGNAVLTWSSLAGKTYSVLTSSDMFTWQIVAENVPSLGDTTTTWTDTTAPFLSPAVRIRYYRTVER